MSKFIFVPQLDASVVWPILRKYRYRLPANVMARSFVAGWYCGTYYGYGNKESWIPLSQSGGIATKAFHDHTVRFPVRIDKALRRSASPSFSIPGRFYENTAVLGGDGNGEDDGGAECRWPDALPECGQG